MISAESLTDRAGPRRPLSVNDSLFPAAVETSRLRLERAGMCGLTCEWDRDRGELGIWLRKRFWGRGYSGERTRALMHLAFERLDLGPVAVGVAAENDRSRRAVEKYIDAAGGRFEGVVRHGRTFFDSLGGA
ncbi:Acetyltransferase (GNAT) domain-containing protein [Halopelagius inordinatus]|uniref:Acetyltransferase (GNAT) domain-containing protein n=1 Tax=Halopelagius inordinatus TaxID=553467 RepID=A0A1I2RUB9_9EURY|nr:GNAT family N-acetyltransferase [Halopelagius inordinatus]SFG44122.1 Acetyltransferase (GNAT) domain-containing protein [Halopelagius inordinatus]